MLDSVINDHFAMPNDETENLRKQNRELKQENQLLKDEVHELKELIPKLQRVKEWIGGSELQDLRKQVEELFERLHKLENCDNLDEIHVPSAQQAKPMPTFMPKAD